MMQPLIFPLNRLSTVGVRALQFALRPKPLLQAAFMQQQMKAYRASLAPKLPLNLPWNATSSRVAVDVLTTIPSVVHQLLPYPPTYFRIIGTTKDSTGVALGNCAVDLFRTSDDVKLDTVTSDANGLYEFRYAGQPPNAYYLVAYKSGTPDVAGTTASTLVGT